MNKRIGLLVAVLAFPVLAFAQAHGDLPAGAGDAKGLVAIAAAVAIGFAAVAGTLSQSRAISAGLEAIGRNPAAAGKVFVPMILGLALIESLVILSFVIANGLLGKV